MNRGDDRRGHAGQGRKEDDEHGASAGARGPVILHQNRPKGVRTGSIKWYLKTAMQVRDEASIVPVAGWFSLAGDFLVWSVGRRAHGVLCVGSRR